MFNLTKNSLALDGGIPIAFFLFELMDSVIVGFFSVMNRKEAFVN